jgi:hypothetical protein
MKVEGCFCFFFALCLVTNNALVVGCKDNKSAKKETATAIAKVEFQKESSDERLKTFAPLLPVSTRALGFFKAEDAWSMLRDLASLMPYRFMVDAPEEIFERTKLIYGVPKEAVSGFCAVANMDKDGGFAVICQGGGVIRPFGAEIFEFQPFRGYLVKHKGLEVLVAEGMGFVVFGTVAGLQRLSQVQNKLYPSLALRVEKMMKSQQDVAMPIETSKMGLWFIEPQSSPFCLLGSCYGCAVYADGEKMEILVQSTEGSAPLALSTLTAYWEKEIKSTYEMLLQGKRGFRVPESALQRAGLLLDTANFEQRGYMVKLSAKGDIAFLFALLHLDTLSKALEPLE